MLDELRQPDVLRIAAIFGGSILLSTLLIALTRYLALRARFTDHPNANTKNHGGAAMGGGVGIVLTILLMLWLFPSHAGAQFRIMLMIVALCVLGLFDDVFKLTPWVKVLGQVACGAIYAWGEPVSGGAAVAMLFFLVLTSNAWNVVDVMDSLLASIGTVAMLGVCMVMLLHGLDPGGLPVVPLVAAGSLIGFLFWNRPPARIIMGDAGSLPLGMLYGVLVLESVPLSALLATAAILPGLIPFLEVGFLLIQRSRRGIPFYWTTPDHFALRLLHNGYSIAQIVRPVVVIGIGLTVLACLLVLTSFHFVPTILVVALLVAAITWAYRFLDRLRVGGTLKVRRTE